jgi:hypothetical protein
LNGEKSGLGIFQVSIRGNSWIISCQDFSAPTNSRALYSAIDACCDGTNIYLVNTVNPTGKAYSAAPNFISHMAQIYTGVYPPPIEQLIHNLWLAFASGSVLSNATGTAKPILGTDLSMFYNTNFVCNYVWTTNGEDKCPRELILKSNGQWFQRDRNNNGKLGFLVRAPYQNGFTMAVGRWLQTTNMAGVYAPIKYDFSTFQMKSKAISAEDLTPWYSFQCTVTNAYSDEIPSIPIPREGEETLVSDHRFAGKGYATATYTITNKWPAANDPKMAGILLTTPKASMEDEALMQHGFKPTQGPRLPTPGIHEL